MFYCTVALPYLVIDGTYSAVRNNYFQVIEGKPTAAVIPKIHCPKSNQNFRDITRNVVENMILHEIFSVCSITFSLLHFMLYPGKSISFGTV